MPQGGKRWSVIAAVFAYLIVACFVAGADAWDPLGQTLGVLAVGTATVGVGLVVGRWPAVLVGLLVVPPLVVLNRAGDPPLFVVFVVPAVAVLCALVAGAAVLVRKLADGRGKDRPAARIGAAAVLAGVAATALGVYLDNRVVDREPSRPQTLDLERAGYRGVRVGSPSADLARVLGSRGRPHGATVPDQEGESGPSSHPSWEVRLFPRLAVFVAKGRVRGIATPDEAAQTTDGVGVGDSLEVAKRRYKGLDCYGVTLGSDAVNPSYPACSGRLKGGNEIYFGGDPIDTVWMTEKGGIEAGDGPILRVR